MPLLDFFRFLHVEFMYTMLPIPVPPPLSIPLTGGHEFQPLAL